MNGVQNYLPYSNRQPRSQTMCKLQKLNNNWDITWSIFHAISECFVSISCFLPDKCWFLSNQEFWWLCKLSSIAKCHFGRANLASVQRILPPISLALSWIKLYHSSFEEVSVHLHISLHIQPNCDKQSTMSKITLWLEIETTAIDKLRWR